MDSFTGRIFQVFILGSLFTGFVYQALYFGMQGVLLAVAGMLFPILVLFPVFAVRGLGAGDIKLFAVIGTFLTIQEYRAILSIIFISFLCSLIQAGILSCIRRQFQKKVHFATAILTGTITYLGGVYWAHIF